jgi:hypothetical protein
MISIDPLYFLLFLELLLIQAALIGVLYLKGRKLTLSYLKTLQMVRDLELKQKTSQQEESVTPAEVPKPNHEEQPISTTDDADKKMLELGEVGPETEQLKKLLEEKVEIILQMKKKIEVMEKKHADMEKEYLILFDQSQKQEEALKAYGEGFKKKDKEDF